LIFELNVLTLSSGKPCFLPLLPPLILLLLLLLLVLLLLLLLLLIILLLLLLLLQVVREAGDGCMDATHTDVNATGRWLRRILIHVMAGVFSWSETAELKLAIATAEELFDYTLQLELNLHPRLMIPGNYARKLIAKASQTVILNLIPEESKEDIKLLLELWRKLRSVWRPLKPTDSDVAGYDAVRRELHNLLYKKPSSGDEGVFGWVLIPPYVHMVIEHVPRWITQYKTVGGYSCEALEAGNKIYRFVRRTATRWNAEGLGDALKYMSLMTNPKLRRHFEWKPFRKSKCKNCREHGHCQADCPNPPQATSTA
jgi:hypothetical protein